MHETIYLISVQNPEMRFISQQLERILLAVEIKTVRSSDLGFTFPIVLEAEMMRLCDRIEEDKQFAKKLVSSITNNQFYKIICFMKTFFIADMLLYKI